MTEIATKEKKYKEGISEIETNVYDGNVYQGNTPDPILTQLVSRRPSRLWVNVCFLVLGVILVSTGQMLWTLFSYQNTVLELRLRISRLEQTTKLLTANMENLVKENVERLMNHGEIPGEYRKVCIECISVEKC